MDPVPSTSQEESTSTSTESSLKHLPTHDVDAFGVSCDLSGLNLPTMQDILRYYFFLAERAKKENKMFSYKIFTSYVTDRLIQIWSKINVETINKNSIHGKLSALLDKYLTVIKHKNRSEYTAFLQTMNQLFHIGKCKCNLKAALCSCGLIPEHLKEFKRDQHNDRKSTIPEYMRENEGSVLTSTIIPTIEQSWDETFVPEEDMDVDDEHSSHSVGARDLPSTSRGPYAPRYDALKFAMMCDRLGVSDRTASALATCLMEDLHIKDDRGMPLIMDKSEVRREKAKCRQEVLRKRYDDCTLIAFSFDGRKNDSFTREKIDEKFHSKMVKEPHLVVLKEPHSELIGYVKLDNEVTEHKVIKLNEFFMNKTISLDALIGICCDGEPANTSIRNGILRRFEIQLKRPLHWFVCLLHFNELPFRHLFATLEKSSTTGPRTATGTLGKQIETCQDLPVVADFEPIELGNMPPALNPRELSTDSKYLYEMANAISNGAVSADLAHIKPGPMAHSRWLTKANRLLRLYVTTNNPSNNLKILAKYIIKVYTPMYFNIKYYGSVVYGGVLFYNFIRWTRYLEPNLRKVVNNVIQDNAYFAHSENILLAMLFDDKKEIRNIAITKILHYRNHVDYHLHLRGYQKPIINFDSTDYTTMIDLNNDDILSEPPFTRSIPYDELKQYLECNDPPLTDPKIPLHIQGTERHVQLLASVSKRVSEEKRESVMMATLESRKKLPRLESKKDFQK